MYFKKANGLIIFVFFLSTIVRCQGCSTNKVRDCLDFPLVKMIDLHAFIPVQMLDEMCPRLQKTLTCVYTTGNLDKCPSILKLPFDSQRDVINAVCGNRRAEYLRSGQCFSTSGLKARIDKDCLATLANYKMLSQDSCGITKRVSDCVRAKIVMTDGCDQIDAALMVDLVDIYMQPTQIQFQCPIASNIDDVGKRALINENEVEIDSSNVSVTSQASQQPQLRENTEIPKSSYVELPPRVETAQTNHETKKEMAHLEPQSSSTTESPPSGQDLQDNENTSLSGNEEEVSSWNNVTQLNISRNFTARAAKSTQNMSNFATTMMTQTLILRLTIVLSFLC